MAYSIKRIVRGARRRWRSHFIRFGSLRHTTPVNIDFGWNQGKPVDRYYVEQFLTEQAELITGRVLEIGGREYTEAFGYEVTSSDILSFDKSNPETTIIGNLASCPQIADNSFDCIVLVDTLHYIFDMTAAVQELRRILAPEGTLLCAVPCLSQISRYDMDRWGDRWRLTSLGLKELLESVFTNTSDIIKVKAYGNALTALCHIEGIPAKRLRLRELDARIDDFEIVVCGVAKKAAL